MRLVCISDTHNYHKDLVLPEGDVLIHCGDFSMGGSFRELAAFIAWIGQTNFKHKICVAGNHDFLAEENPTLIKAMFQENGVNYLVNESVEIDGYTFWGSPYTLQFMDWAFMKAPKDIEKIWVQIPDKVDVLITHGPPFRILDQTSRRDHVGCASLLYHTTRVKPKIHCFGHIHEAYGSKTIWWNGDKAAECRQTPEDKTTVFLNCASMDEHYSLEHEPMVIDLE